MPKERRDLRELLDLPEMLDPLDYEAMQVVLALSVLKDGPVPPGRRVPPELAVIVVHPEMWDRLALLVRPEALEELAPWVLQVRPEHLARLVP